MTQHCQRGQPVLQEPPEGLSSRGLVREGVLGRSNLEPGLGTLGELQPKLRQGKEVAAAGEEEGRKGRTAPPAHPEQGEMAAKAVTGTL